MKIVFKVWAPPHEATIRPPTSVSRPIWSSVTPSRATTIITTTTTTTKPSTTTTKKSKAYDKHPNEVVKSEELTLGGNRSSGHYITVNNAVATIVLLNVIVFR